MSGNIIRTARNINKLVKEEYISKAKSIVETAETINKEASGILDIISAKDSNISSKSGVFYNSYTPSELEEIILEPGLRLHFMRRGVFEGDDHVEGDHFDITNKRNRLLRHDDFTEGDAVAHIHSTNLQGGCYIYVIYEAAATPEASFEYQITNTQCLQRIKWVENDLREVELKTPSKTYHLVPEEQKEKTAYIVYSPVQWSAELFKRVCANENGLRDQLATEITCIKIDKESEDEKLRTEISLAFNTKKEYTNFKRQYDAVKGFEDKSTNPSREDLFISLDAPINQAKELADILADKTLRFKGLIEAIETGENEEQAYQRILKEGVKPTITQEYSSLYNLALSTYHMVYEDAKSRNKYDGGAIGWGNFKDLHYGQEFKTHKVRTADGYDIRSNRHFIGNGVDGTKVAGILGVEYRKKKREELTHYRNLLVQFLEEHIPLQRALEQYLINADDRTLEGMAGLCEIADALFTLPVYFERHLLLKKDYEAYVKNDKGLQWVMAISDANRKHVGNGYSSISKKYKGDLPTYALMALPLNVEKIVDSPSKTFKKIFKVFKSIAGYESKREMMKLSKTVTKISIQSQEAIVRSVVTRLRRVRVFDEEMFEISKSQFFDGLEANKGKGVTVALTKEAKEAIGKYAGKKTDVLRLIKDNEAAKLVKTSRGNHIFEVKVRISKEFEEIIKQPSIEEISKVSKNNKRIEFFKAMTQSKSFNGFVAFLEVYNFGNSVLAFGDIKSNEIAKTGKQVVGTIGSSLKTTEAGVKLAKSFGVSSSLDDIIAMTPQGAVSKLNIIGAAGSGITALMCFWDGTELLLKDDIDAGLTYFLAGAFLGFSAYAGLFIAGPIGWITALIGTGFYFLATVLIDTDLEVYFKNYLLTDRVGKPIGTLTPMAYNRAVYEARATLITDTDYQELRDPYTALARLYDLTVCPEVGISLKKEDHLRGSNRRSGTYYTVIEAEAKLYFTSFLTDASAVEAEAYVCKGGVDSNDGERIKIPIENSVKIDEKGISYLSLKANTKGYATRDSEVLFAVRLVIAEGLYFPWKRNKQDYYLCFQSEELSGTNVLTTSFTDTLQSVEKALFLPQNQIHNADNW